MLACLLASLLCGVSAEPDLSALIQQLGATSYEARDAAEAELAALGLTVLPALEAGTRNPDVEIRTRCARLLRQAHELDRKARIRAFLDEPEGSDAAALPGWKRYRELGVEKATRKTYVALYESDPVLLDLTGKDSRKAVALIRERADDLSTVLLLPMKDRDAVAQLPALLFVVADPALAIEPAVLKDLYTGLSILAHREALLKDFLKQPGVPQLLLATLQRGGANLHSITLPLAGQLTLPSAHEWALRLVTTPTTPPASRALAILLVAEVGTPADIAALVPLLTDRTEVGKATVASKTLNAELGDVALAAILHLGGEKPADYGFPYFEAIPGLKSLPSPERLGFIDNASRTAALAKWRNKMAKP